MALKNFPTKIQNYLVEVLLKNRTSTDIKFGALNDHISSQILAHGSYELSVRKKIHLNFLTKIDGEFSALDVGANIGVWSVFLSSFCHKVYAFEPQDEVFMILRANTIHLKNVKVINNGLSSCVNDSIIYVPNGNIGGATLENSGDNGDQVVKRVSIDIGDNFNYSGRIGFIKIDVEGHEYDVIYGLQRTIVKNSPFILFECLKSMEYYEKIKSLLLNLGYNSFIDLETMEEVVDHVPKLTVACCN